MGKDEPGQRLRTARSAGRKVNRVRVGQVHLGVDRCDARLRRKWHGTRVGERHGRLLPGSNVRHGALGLSARMGWHAALVLHDLSCIQTSLNAMTSEAESQRRRKGREAAFGACARRRVRSRRPKLEQTDGSRSARSRTHGKWNPAPHTPGWHRRPRREHCLPRQ